MSTEQRNFYIGCKNNLYYDKAAATAGIRLEFYANSELLKLELEMHRADTETAFTNNIYVNGKGVAVISGDIKDYPEKAARLFTHLSLGEGMKHIAIYLSWSADSRLVSLELDDGASVMPAKKIRKNSFLRRFNNTWCTCFG